MGAREVENPSMGWRSPKTLNPGHLTVVVTTASGMPFTGKAQTVRRIFAKVLQSRLDLRGDADHE